VLFIVITVNFATANPDFTPECVRYPTGSVAGSFRIPGVPHLSHAVDPEAAVRITLDAKRKQAPDPGICPGRSAVGFRMALISDSLFKSTVRNTMSFPF
jgi:hypothetical protein